MYNTIHIILYDIIHLILHNSFQGLIKPWSRGVIQLTSQEGFLRYTFVIVALLFSFLNQRDALTPPPANLASRLHILTNIIYPYSRKQSIKSINMSIQSITNQLFF